MTKEDFLRYKNSSYSHIPVYEEFTADLVSPLYVYSNFYNQENTFLFESAKSHEVKGRYSIMSLPSQKKYNYFKDELEIVNDSQTTKQRIINAYDHIDKISQSFSSPKINHLPEFLGGLVGYFSYESFQFIEHKVTFPDQDIPLISLIECNELIIFDNFKGTFYIVVNTTDKSEIGWEKAKKRISEIKQAVFSLQPSVNQSISIDNKSLKSSSNVDKKTFINQVKELKKLINQGEIMQAVLSKEITFDGEFDPYTLYRALRLINPSPYMFFLNFDKFRIIGSSPEILVQKNDDKVTIRPIAGTRRRGLNKSEDLKNKIDLIEDEKEKSEHMMLVDLARNDLSKVCEQGTVQVDEMMVVEKYSHVMHMTSNVIGRSKTDVSTIDCMKAALPAGTLSGAPKIRAMEILSEIEKRPRGVYGGAVGYLGFNGSLDTAIVIRTGMHFDDHVKVGVGAGIVYDSDPDSEWEETESKAKVFYEALRYK